MSLFFKNRVNYELACESMLVMWQFRFINNEKSLFVKTGSFAFLNKN